MQDNFLNQSSLLGHRAGQIPQCATWRKHTYPVIDPAFTLLGRTCSLNYKISPFLTLAGVAQWIEHRPVNERVAGSIPSQGIYLGCGPRPQ